MNEYSDFDQYDGTFNKKDIDIVKNVEDKMILCLQVKCNKRPTTNVLVPRKSESMLKKMQDRI